MSTASNNSNAPVNNTAPSNSTAAPATNTTPNQSPGAAQPSNQPKAPTQERTLTLKIEGKEVSLPESEVLALAQQGKVSAQRFQEAARARKEAEMLWEMLQNNPAEALKRRGIDVRKFSEETLLKYLEQEQMSPEQKKAFENEQKLREYEDRDKRAKQEAMQREYLESQQKFAQEYTTHFIKALEESGLPRTDFTMKRMAELQLVNHKKKLNLDASSLAKLVREDYIREQKALFGAMEGDSLLEALGPDLVKKLSKAQIAKLRAQGHTFTKSNTPKQESSDSKKRPSWRDVQKRRRII